MLSILRNIMFFILSIILPILILAGLTYMVFNRGGLESSVDTNNDIMSLHLNYMDKALDINKEIRAYADINKDRINLKNCKGLLQDSDKNGYFDITPLFDLNNQFKSNLDRNEINIVIYYNLCSFNYSDQNKIELIATTDYLLEKGLKHTGGMDYFKGNQLKSIKSRITKIKTVYAPLEIIIDNQ